MVEDERAECTCETAGRFRFTKRDSSCPQHGAAAPAGSPGAGEDREEIIACMGCGQDFDWTDDAQSRYHESACIEVEHEPARVEIARRLRESARPRSAPAELPANVAAAAAALRSELRAAGFSRLRDALVGQHSDALFASQWNRHKARLIELLDALDDGPAERYGITEAGRKALAVDRDPAP